jgi:hypothetical protein
VRYSCSHEGYFQPAPQPAGDLWWHAVIQDVSLGGVALATHRRFEPGAILDVELPAADGGPGRTLLARVRRVGEQGDGTWVIGCEFMRRIDEDDFRALIQAPPSTEPGAE